MIAKASLRFARITPRKIRTVIRLIRGKPLLEAQAILENLNKRGGVILSKLLKSASSNAQRYPNIELDNLYISRIYADSGAMLKRYRAAPMGRAVMVRKRTAHINLELDAIRKIELAKPKKAATGEVPATVKKRKKIPTKAKR